MCTTSCKRLCKNINSIKQEVVDEMIKRQSDRERDTTEVKKFAYHYTLKINSGKGGQIVVTEEL